MAKDERSVARRGMTRWSDKPLPPIAGERAPGDERRSDATSIDVESGWLILSSGDSEGFRKEDKDFGRMGDVDPKVDENKGAWVRHEGAPRGGVCTRAGPDGGGPSPVSRPGNALREMAEDVVERAKTVGIRAGDSHGRSGIEHKGGSTRAHRQRLMVKGAFGETIHRELELEKSNGA
ncbi:hypothetical protein EHS25_008892 [Saitozyma podzolica]|uniref:Uncharacterized protein n=1 Tax=Saitozyma podzolica TaxID=1890683 RepID=A0A427YN27_9TREE|nr:hypothetical protein EHS25_008892 [Saitozyma podzolica]